MKITTKGEFEKIKGWCLGNDMAALFLVNFYRVSQIADDFVDRDVPDEQIDHSKMLELLHLTLVDIPTNLFYQRYSHWLIPLMSASCMIWDATETWKKSDLVETRMFAYAYREIAEQVLYIVARILGGLDHAKKVIQEAHEYYHVLDRECFEAWDRKE